MIGQVHTLVSVIVYSESHYEDKEYGHINKPTPLLIPVF